MTQREAVLKLLKEGPLSSSEVGNKLGLKRTNAGSALSRLKSEGWVQVVDKIGQVRFYALADQKYECVKSTSHHFDIPSLTRCSCCKKPVDKHTRKLEERPTGPAGAIQIWAFCIPHFKEQQESRKIRPHTVMPHLSTLAQNAPLFRLRRKA